MQIHIKAAEGGDHSKRIVTEIATAYTKYLDRKGWLHTIETADGSAVISCKDIPAFENEAGGHRWQEVSGKGRKSKIHTSTVTVSVIMQSMMQSERSYPDDEFEVTWHRGTGKGGQRRNKVATCCVVTHTATGLSAKADGRSRLHNEQNAKHTLLSRLRERDHARVDAKLSQHRRNQTGSGQRGDKIRTYRHQEGVVKTNSGKSMPIKRFLNGHIEGLWT